MKYQYRFWWGNLKGIHHLKNLGLDRKIILKLISEKWGGVGSGVNWVDLAHGMNEWRAVVTTAMNLSV